MNLNEPQFIYMILVLPILFGLSLVAEGLNKILKEENQGWFSITLGLIFITIVVSAYFFLLRKGL